MPTSAVSRRRFLNASAMTLAAAAAPALTNPAKAAAQSAGIKLAQNVNPLVVEAMAEKGIDISNNKPKMLTQEMANQADLIVTMGCGASDLCPGPFFKETVDWALEDPKGKSIEKVREIRDEIERRVKELILAEK